MMASKIIDINKPLRLTEEEITNVTPLVSSLKLPILIDRNDQGSPRFADLVDLKHILMSGPTGSGKSFFEHALIQLLSHLRPDGKFVLVDMKQVDLVEYKKLPQLYSMVLVDSEKTLSILDTLQVEKNKRLQDSSLSYPYIVVIIDTFSDILAYDGDRFITAMKKLLPDAADAHIHIILSDSRESDQVFSKELIELFPTRLYFRYSKDS